MRKFGLNKKLFLALWILLSSFTSAAHADYNNPTRASDCNLHSGQYDFSARLSSFANRIRQCLSEPNQGRWISIPACGYPGGQRCAKLEGQRCQLENQMRGIREMCMIKLEARQAKERERKIIEEQAARERQQFLRDTAAAAVTPGAIDKELRPAGEILGGLGAGGALAGKFSGLKLTKPGALHLSAALSAESLRINQAIQTVTLERFRAAMAEHAKRDPSFEANFGEPTPGKIQALDARLDELKVLESQIKQATAAVESALPVGGESAVVGRDAEHLTRIAQSIVAGSLNASLFDTSANDAVSMMGKRGTIDNEREVRQQNSPGLAGRVSEQELGARRRGTYNFVAGYIESATQRKIEAARKAEEARRAARKAEEDRKKRLDEQKKPKSDMESWLETDGWRVDAWNEEARRKEKQRASNSGDVMQYIISKPDCVSVRDEGESYTVITKCRYQLTVDVYGNYCTEGRENTERFFLQGWYEEEKHTYYHDYFGFTLKKPCTVSVTVHPEDLRYYKEGGYGFAVE